jgi:type III pantothenate kinase
MSAELNAGERDRRGLLLAIDVGNTNIVLGVFEGERLIESWRLPTLRERTADELGILVVQLFQHWRVDPGRIGGSVMASVVPPLTGTVAAMTQRYFGLTTLTIDGETPTGMPVLYKHPAEVGSDRLVNGIAAYERYGRRAGIPVIVVDFGTATTMDAVTARGEYLGGVICPGVQISADALFQRAARLPRVDVRKPPQVIGRSTVESMQSGLFYGYIGMVEGLVERMRRELGGSAVCVATGGLARVIAPETTVLQEVEPDLTLYGLRIVWDRNEASRDPRR